MDYKYKDPSGCCWENYKDYVFSLFGYSSYSGETENAVMKTLEELWNAFKNDESYFIRDHGNEYEWAFQELLLSLLSKADLTEYGCSPRGSWLTQKGKELLKPLFEPTETKSEGGSR